MYSFLVSTGCPTIKYLFDDIYYLFRLYNVGKI
jgi:hypothetical protein